MYPARRSLRMTRYLALISLLALTMGSCRQEETTTTDTGPAKVEISLTEWAVSVDPSSAEAGKTTFEVRNTGTENHEFVIVKTDLPLTDLPTKPDGSVDEEGQGIEVIDEIEEFPPGETPSLEADLAAGNYVFLCNLVDAKGQVHYKNGMRNSFKAT